LVEAVVVMDEDVTVEDEKMGQEVIVEEDGMMTGSEEEKGR
jgi:hypothetical protein